MLRVILVEVREFSDALLKFFERHDKGDVPGMFRVVADHIEGVERRHTMVDAV